MVSKSTRRRGRKAASINHIGASRDECRGEAHVLGVYCSYGEDGQRVLTARKHRVWRKRQLVFTENASLPKELEWKREAQNVEAPIVSSTIDSTIDIQYNSFTIQ